jgi:hypothetical protein
MADIEIAEHYPLLAGQLEHLSVIRSLVSKEGDHDRACYLLKTGYRPDPTVQHPSLGSIVAHERPNQRLEIPQFITLGYDPHPSRGGYLGSQFDSFQLSNPGEGLQNLDPRVDEARQRRRLENLRVVGGTFREGRRSELDATLYEHSLAASLKMMTTEQLKALRIDDEPESVRAAYGDNSFGRGCLIARRLVEQGVRAINVVLQNFDTHEDNFSRHQVNAAMLDPAFARLLVELRERDLWQSTLVLCIGEFGRTPRINERDGRDHWPQGFSCLLGGAGLSAGVAIGATDPEGKQKTPADPIQVADLNATLLAALGIDYSAEMQTPIGRPMKLSAGVPISRLIST